MNNHSYIKIRSFSYHVIINKLNSQNILFYSFKILENDWYLIEVKISDEKKVINLFKESKIVKRCGIKGRIKNLLVNKITIVSLLISSLMFIDITNRISSIKINGINKKMTNLIALKVEELGLKKYARIPNFETLVNIEEEIKITYSDYLDMLEVRQNGTIINIKYLIRNEAYKCPELTSSLFAKKDGIISHYVLKSGQKMVEEGQFVRKGDLLVSDTITNSKGSEVYIGAYGSVFAKTWTIIDVELSEIIDQSEAFVLLINEAKNIMCKDFSNDEKIIDEKILKFEIIENKIHLKIHFTCIENIAN